MNMQCLYMMALLCTGSSKYLRLDASPEEESRFSAFIEDNHRGYKRGTPEYKDRLALFVRRLRKTEAHNSQPGVMWTTSLNHFSDQTDKELRFFLGYRASHDADSSSGGFGPSALTMTGNQGGNHSASSNIQVGDVVNAVASDGETSGFMRGAQFVTAAGDRSSPHHAYAVDTRTLLDSVDWASKYNENFKKQLAVPDQKKCGSCWAMTTANVLDIWHQMVNGAVANTTEDFSPQELVNCVPNPRKCGGDGGCQGATVELAMDYALKVGLSRLSTVGYEGLDHTQACSTPCENLEDQSHPCKAEMRGGGNMFGLVGWNMLPRNQALPLRRAAMDGPVAISVAADPIFDYEKGIFNGCGRNVGVNHAVTLVGYGEEKGTGYWHIMNSWKDTWGEGGYIRMHRELDDSKEEAKCGIDSKPLEGTMCEGGPSQVKVCGMCGLLYDAVRPYFGGKGGATQEDAGAGGDAGSSAAAHVEWGSVTQPDKGTERTAGLIAQFMEAVS